MIALGGKTLRGSLDRLEARSAPQVLSAFATGRLALSEVEGADAPGQILIEDPDKARENRAVHHKQPDSPTGTERPRKCRRTCERCRRRPVSYAGCCHSASLNHLGRITPAIGHDVSGLQISICLPEWHTELL